MKREVVSPEVHVEDSAVVADGNGSGRAHPELKGEVEDIHLYTSLGRIWLRRRLILQVVGAFLAVAVIYRLGDRAEFTAGATLMPEKQSDSAVSIGGLDLLQDFGGLLGGMSANNLLSKPSSLPVQLYPEIAKSTPILLRLLETEVLVPSTNRPATLFIYLASDKPFSLWETIGDGMKSSSRALVRLVRKDRIPVVLQDSSIVYLTTAQMDVVRDLRKRVDADLDKRTGMLSISVTLPDPHVAAQAARASVAALTDYVTRYRLQKLEQDLAFIRLRHDEAKRGFNAANDELARFRDRNQNLARRIAQTEEKRLEAEYDVAFNVYSSLATKLEESKIKVQEETPVFQVLQPVTIPLEKSRPKTLLILCLALLLGLAAGSMLVLSGVDVARIRRTFGRSG